jgi:hypothetical protein
LCQQTLLVNTYAISRCINGKERETSFNAEIIYLLRHLPQNYIIGGDIHCVISRNYCMGVYNPCTALEALVENRDAVDVWKNIPDRRTHTYCAAKVAPEYA